MKEEKRRGYIEKSLIHNISIEMGTPKSYKNTLVLQKSITSQPTSQTTSEMKTPSKSCLA